MITFPDIEAARRRLGEAVYQSPCAYSETFSKRYGNKVYFKLENLQMTGSFKERGALNKLLLLAEGERRAGVVAASAGNHAQGVAYHATRLGLRATIVMPVTTPLIKVTSTRGYGAEVVLCGGSYDEAFAEAERRAAATGATLVHAFDDPAVMAGQGTIGLELLEQNPYLEAVLVPVGGGGMIAGIAVAMKETNPRIRIIGVQTERLPSMKAAVAEKRPVTLPAAPTLADGIAVRRAGEHTLPVVLRYVDDIVTVDEEELANAVLLLLEREKTVAEGAGAAATAALISGRTGLAGKRVCALVGGGNIDVNLLSRIIERGLVKDGRLVRLRVHIADHAGALHKLLGVVAAERANIIEIEHNRAFSKVDLGETAVDVTLETRGPDHIAELERALRAAGYELERLQPDQWKSTG
ncbi:MAG TPA: threonine ammonia-lyase [Polyangia bacterium]|nr:threonine ammonia-lyase [Polyangia bacterium]